MGKNIRIYWAIWGVMLLFLALICTEVFPYPSTEFLTYVSVVEFLFVSHFFYVHPSLKYFGLSHVHFIYAAMGSLAVGWVYFILGADFVQYGSPSTGKFINPSSGTSLYYAPALVISLLSFHFYPLGCFLGIKSNRKVGIITKTDERSTNAIANLGIVLLALTAFLFVFLMYLEVFSINMNYEAYRLLLDNFPILHLIVIFYSIGICSVVACGGKNQQRLGWILFAFVAFLYFSTGNKGEVLYATLSVIGVLIYKGLKIDWRFVACIALLLFFVIPFITASRHEGVLSGKTDASINFTNAFVEIGTQIRCTVLLLEQFAIQTRDYLWGYSYYSPILNILNYIIPGIRIKEPASFDFSDTFSGMGFNQVAEGYANFGILGSVLYFGITGYYLGKNESRQLTPVKLGLVACICSELINVSRNRFAFFWGHVLLIYILYKLAIFIVNRKIIIR